MHGRVQCGGFLFDPGDVARSQRSAFIQFHRLHLHVRYQGLHLLDHRRDGVCRCLFISATHRVERLDEIQDDRTNRSSTMTTQHIVHAIEYQRSSRACQSNAPDSSDESRSGRFPGGSGIVVAEIALNPGSPRGLRTSPMVAPRPDAAPTHGRMAMP